MTLKTAALMALIGTALLTILLVVSFVNNTVAWMSGVIPAMAWLSSFIQTLEAFSLALFFFVYHRDQR